MKWLLGAALGLLSAAAPAALLPGPAPERTFYLDYGYHEAAEGTAELGFVARRYRPAPEVTVDSIFSLDARTLRRVLTRTRRPGGDTLVAAVHWLAGGTRAREEERLAGKLHGTQRLYDAQGRLQRQARYERGQRRDSTCFDAQGAAGACTGRFYTEQLPEYPGGMAGLMRYLAQSIRYPAEALRRRAQGKVEITFLVDETGQPRDVHVSQGVLPALDAEALRVMRLMGRWAPGRQQGEPVPVYYTVPVTFAIR
ncbi:energy transducer TonB [Hymenobacter gummosus]|uniref:Energy transducer TonB n=1 Tax=Hymenobacter gummosus TaxID=1776032 RepID=A0A3S0HJI7_9BACT|nr:energy transducer TonB [Hymenobacter gummosus]RTQ45610.1 energy transducer TonB [Hymenobacter gummosus]